MPIAAINRNKKLKHNTIMEKKHITISYNEFSNVNELEEYQQKLIRKAELVLKNAYAPFSNFKVGAAVLLSNNKVVTGCNQENAAFPSGLCAERVALFSAASKYPGVKVKCIAIAAESSNLFSPDIVTPCGACCQVMSEFQLHNNEPIEVLFKGKNKIIQLFGIQQLLPFTFKTNG